MQIDVLSRYILYRKLRGIEPLDHARSGPLKTVHDMPLRRITDSTHRPNTSYGIVCARVKSSVLCRIRASQSQAKAYEQAQAQVQVQTHVKTRTVTTPTSNSFAILDTSKPKAKPKPKPKTKPVVVTAQWPDDYEFLIVKRRNTYEFESIVRGRFTDHTALAMLAGLTAYEIELLKKHSHAELWADVTWGSKAKPASGALERFNRAIGLLDMLPAGWEPAPERIMWSFPKGKPEPEDGCPYKTARREFEEETLIELGPRNCCANEPLGRARVIGSNYEIYEHIFFLHVFNAGENDKPGSGQAIETTPCRKIWRNEIQETAWIAYSDLTTKLNELHLPVISAIGSYPPDRVLSGEAGSGCILCQPQD